MRDAQLTTGRFRTTGGGPQCFHRIPRRIPGRIPGRPQRVSRTSRQCTSKRSVASGGTSPGTPLAP